MLSKLNTQYENIILFAAMFLSLWLTTQERVITVTNDRNGVLESY